MKTLLVIFVLLCGAGYAFAAGYRLHFENLHYYLKVNPSSGAQEVEFTNGTTLTGTVESETEDKIRINVDGAVTEFSRSEIRAVRTSGAQNIFLEYIANAKSQQKQHPFITQSKSDTLNAKWDEMALEPSRIAEQMKKKNPSISASAEMERTMAINAQARQKAYKERAAEQQADQSM